MYRIYRVRAGSQWGSGAGFTHGLPYHTAEASHTVLYIQEVRE